MCDLWAFLSKEVKLLMVDLQINLDWGPVPRSHTQVIQFLQAESTT